MIGALSPYRANRKAEGDWMRFLLKTLFMSATILMTGAVHNTAQSNGDQCYERWNLLYVLVNERGEKLDESRQLGGIGCLEAYKSTTGGTWTIVYSKDHAVSCILASGVGLNGSEAANPPRVTIEYSI